MNITRNGSQPSAKGPAEYFTGTVRIDSPFKGSAPSRVGGAIRTIRVTEVSRRGTLYASSEAP